MSWDVAGSGPGWVTVRTPGPNGQTVIGKVRQETLIRRALAMATKQSNGDENLAAAAPDEDAAKETERRAKAADKADVTPHAQWRNEQIQRAGKQDSPEAVAAEAGHVNFADDSKQ